MTLIEIAGVTSKTEAEIPVQVSRITRKETAAGKPYFAVTLSDATHSATISAWSDTQAFSELENNLGGGFYFVKAGFQKNDYGLNASGTHLRRMNSTEQAAFLAGGEDQRKVMDADWNEIYSAAQALEVPTLKAVVLAILDDPKNQERYVRAAAALKNHHNRRGGLLSHTASMLRVGKAIAGNYADVCPSLLYAGIILHNFGKIVENDTEDGFSAIPNATGELIGHISIAAGIVGRVWRECAAKQPDLFKGQNFVCEHLLHLILSHHGTKEFGSPVTPRTPEAFLLHHIDTLDAHMEMVRAAYATVTPNPQGLVDAPFPLKTSLVVPLATRLAGLETR